MEGCPQYLAVGIGDRTRKEGRLREDSQDGSGCHQLACETGRMRIGAEREVALAGHGTLRDQALGSTRQPVPGTEPGIAPQ